MNTKEINNNNRDPKGRFEKKRKSQETEEDEFPLSKKNLLILFAWLLLVYVIWKNKYLDKLAEKSDKIILGFGTLVGDTCSCHTNCTINFFKSSKDELSKLLFDVPIDKSNNKFFPDLNNIPKNAPNSNNIQQQKDINIIPLPLNNLERHPSEGIEKTCASNLIQKNKISPNMMMNNILPKMIDEDSNIRVMLSEEEILPSKGEITGGGTKKKINK